MLEADNVHSLTDFVRNSKTHRARIRQTKAAEVLTVHGRPELVLLAAESYQDLLDKLQHMEAVATIRSDIEQARQHSGTQFPEAVSAEEMERRRAVMRELMAETERLGLYR